MPYTDAWNTTDPSGNVAANTIDTEIQKLRLQLQERVFATLFETPYTDDPLVVKASVSGAKTSKTIMIAPYGISPEQDEDNYAWEDGYVTIDEDGTLRQPVILPQGVTITQVEWLVAEHLSSNVECYLMETQFTAAPAAPTGVAAASSVAAGSTAALLTDSALSILVGPNDMYFIKVACTGGVGGCRYWGCRITYDAPDSRNTY